jgi:hypothetical protein
MNLSIQEGALPEKAKNHTLHQDEPLYPQDNHTTSPHNAP